MSIKDITLGRYVHGTSVLHRLDPRTKLLSLLVISVVLFTGNNWYSLAIVGVYAGTACVLSGLKPSYLFRSLMPFKWLIIITVLLNIITVGGHIVIEAPLPYGGITLEGLESGILYGCRIAFLVILASILTLTTEPISLVDGIEKLLYPFKKVGLNPHDTAIAMAITIRFIPILLDEAVKIRKSLIARGLRPDGGMIAKMRTVSLLFLPLFHSAVRRAENLAIAMDCRLYRSGKPRTRFNETRILPRDWAVLIVSVIVAATIMVI